MCDKTELQTVSDFYKLVSQLVNNPILKKKKKKKKKKILEIGNNYKEIVISLEMGRM
jgi:hypothetical protein